MKQSRVFDISSQSKQKLRSKWWADLVKGEDKILGGSGKG